jgi:hypothetical protein
MALMHVHQKGPRDRRQARGSHRVTPRRVRHTLAGRQAKPAVARPSPGMQRGRHAAGPSHRRC